MKTLSFEDIAVIVARHQAAEAAQNTPVAVARRAVFEIVSLLEELNDRELTEILTLIDDEIMAPIALREG